MLNIILEPVVQRSWNNNALAFVAQSPEDRVDGAGESGCHEDVFSGDWVMGFEVCIEKGRYGAAEGKGALGAGTVG